MAATSTFLYVIVNAFTDSSFGGNPAAIVLLPPGSLTAGSMPLDATKMSSIARSFAQPITAFLSPSIHVESSDSDENLIYDILFVVDKYFAPVCGHGTLAATKAICRGMFPGVSQAMARNPVVKFRASNDVILYSRMMDSGGRDSTADGEFYEVAIPVPAVQEVTGEERNDVRKMLAKVLGKDADNIELKYVGLRTHGSPNRRLMLVLGQHERLEGRDINISAFVSQFEAVLSNSYVIRWCLRHSLQDAMRHIRSPMLLPDKRQLLYPGRSCQ